MNKLHVDAGLEPPALGPTVTDFRKGSGREQVEEGCATNAVRVYLPAELVVPVRDLALSLCLQWTQGTNFARSQKQSELFRSVVFTFIQYCLFARSDTGVHLWCKDIWYTSKGWHITLRSLKGKSHTGHIKPLLFPLGAVHGLDEVLKVWMQLQKVNGAKPDDNLWRLPWDSRKTWPASLGDVWLQYALTATNAPSPPPGEKWTSHSSRKGATTSAAAIGVTDTKFCYVGDWSVKSAVYKDYIDPTAWPTQAMHQFFGWLLQCDSSPQ